MGRTALKRVSGRTGHVSVSRNMVVRPKMRFMAVPNTFLYGNGPLYHVSCNIAVNNFWHHCNVYIRPYAAYIRPLIFMTALKKWQGMQINASPTNANDSPMMKYACNSIIMPVLFYFRWLLQTYQIWKLPNSPKK